MPRSPTSNSPVAEAGETNSPKSLQNGVAEADPASPSPYRSRSIPRSPLQTHGLVNNHSPSRSRSPPLHRSDGLQENRAPATQRSTTGGPSDQAELDTGRRRDLAADWRTETETQLQLCIGNCDAVTTPSTSRISAPERHASESTAVEQMSLSTRLGSQQLPVRERPRQTHERGLEFSNAARRRLGEQLGAERITRRFFQRSGSEPLHEQPDQLVGRSRRRRSTTPEGYRSSRHVRPLAYMMIRRVLRQGLLNVGEYRSWLEGRRSLQPAPARSRYAAYGRHASHDPLSTHLLYDARTSELQTHPQAPGGTHERNRPISHRRQQGIDQTVRPSPLHPANRYDHDTRSGLPNPLCPPHITCTSCANCVHHSHCQEVGSCIHPGHDIIHGNCMHSGPCDNTRGRYHTTDWPHVTNITNSPPTAEINYLRPESMLQVGRSPTLREIVGERHLRVAAWLYSTSIVQALDDEETTDAVMATSDVTPAAQQPSATDTHELDVARAEELVRESLNITQHEQAGPHHEGSPSDVKVAQGEEVMYDTNMHESEYANTLPASSSLGLNIPESNEVMQQCITHDSQMDDADVVGLNTGDGLPLGTIDHINTVHEVVATRADPATEMDVESGDEREDKS